MSCGLGASNELKLFFSEMPTFQCPLLNYMHLVADLIELCP